MRESALFYWSREQHVLVRWRRPPRGVNGKIAEIAERVGKSEGNRDRRDRIPRGRQAAALADLHRQAGRRHPRRLRVVLAEGRRRSWMPRTLIPGENYTLEVSSPGVERKLTQAARLPAIRRTESKDRHARSRRRTEALGRRSARRRRRADPDRTRGRPSDPHPACPAVKRANLKFEW